MTAITIYRQAVPLPANMDAARAFLFECYDGLSERKVTNEKM